MPSSTISIKVNGQWNGSALKSAINDLGNLGKAADKAGGLYTSNAQRIATQTASLSTSSTSALAKASTKMVQFGRDVESVGNKLSGIGSSLTRGVTMPLLAIGGYAGAMAVQFDTSMANVRKVTDMTEAELQSLADSALELSTTQPVTAEQILNIEALGAQLGVADSALESFSMTVNGLDIATNMNAETAAMEMQRFANITGMADTAYQNYGSTIVALGNNMSTTESEISTMSLRLAAAGDIAGLSEAEILGMSAAMSSLGIKAEAGGSAMTTIMSKISKAVATGGSDLEAFASVAGMSAQEFASAWKSDAMGALESLLQGIHDLDEGGQDMNVTLSELGINEIRQSDAIRRLANETGVLTDAVDLATSAWEDNSALTNEVDQRNQSMASRLQTLKNQLDAIAIQVGGPIVEALIDALTAAQPFIQGIADIAQAFADLDEEQQRSIVNMGLFAAAAGPVTNALGSVVSKVGQVIQGVGHFGQNLAIMGDALNTVDGSSIRLYQSTGTLAGKIGLAGNSAVQAAGDVQKYVDVWEAWYDNNRKVGSLEKQISDAIKTSGASAGIAADAVDAYTEKLGRQQATAERAATKNRNLLDVWQGVVDPASDAGRAAMDYSKQLDATGKYTTTAAKSTGLFSTALGGIKGAASTAAAGVVGLVTTFGPMIAATAAIALVGAAIAAIADEAAKAEEHQRLLSEATMTFGEISEQASMSAKSEAASISDIGDSVQETLQGLADLNQKAAETMDEFYTSSATLDAYVATIEELANKSNLTITEQERLKTAVAGYNEITGQSVEVTDAASGQLSVSTQELAKNAEAWKANARAQAYQSLAVDYIKQQTEAQIELQRAEEDLAQKRAELAYATEQYNAGNEDYADDVIKLSSEVQELEGTLGEAQEAYDSATQSVNDLTVAQAMEREECKAMADALSALGPELTDSLAGAGVNLDAFAVKLAEAGVSTETLNQVGSANIAALAQAFDGDINKMVWAIQNYNNVPVENKDGTIDVNDAQLINAQGELYTWNGSTLVDQYGNAVVYDDSLVDAQGNLYIWNGSELVSKTSSANVNGNVPSGQAKSSVDNVTTAIRSMMNRNVNVNAYGNYSWAADRIGALNSKIANLTGKTVNVIANVIGGRAAGGIKLHADGGIVPRYHANGAIATRAVPLDIVGEAGAEAIVPLSNKRYAMPFVNMLADGITKRTPPQTVNNYSLYIDGSRAQNMTPRVMEALETVFGEFGLTSDMGVM